MSDRLAVAVAEALGEALQQRGPIEANGAAEALAGTALRWILINRGYLATRGVLDDLSKALDQLKSDIQFQSGRSTWH